jgi:hypothetical protein
MESLRQNHTESTPKIEPSVSENGNGHQEQFLESRVLLRNYIDSQKKHTKFNDQESHTQFNLQKFKSWLIGYIEAEKKRNNTAKSNTHTLVESSILDSQNTDILRRSEEGSFERRIGLDIKNLEIALKSYEYKEFRNLDMSRDYEIILSELLSKLDFIDDSIQFQNGKFENIQSLQQESKDIDFEQIQSQQDIEFSKIKSVLSIYKYKVENQADLENVLLQINSDKENLRKGFFARFFNRRKIKDLDRLTQENGLLNKNLKRFNELKLQKNNKLIDNRNYELNQSKVNQVNRIYSQLPDFIKDQLQTSQNQDIKSIQQFIKSNLDRIVKYRSTLQNLELKKQQLNSLISPRI